MRARYTDGGDADSPWNGPWNETTAQVKQPLPAAPNIMGTALTPEGQVMLFSITGYQVLRGPDADNLTVIEDDTGSSATSYTDTEPPPGQRQLPDRHPRCQLPGTALATPRSAGRKGG